MRSGRLGKDIGWPSAGPGLNEQVEHQMWLIPPPMLLVVFVEFGAALLQVLFTSWNLGGVHVALVATQMTWQEGQIL